MRHFFFRRLQKIKTKMRQEVVIGGFTEPRKSRVGFGALLVGVYEKGRLVYVGHVGTGFDEDMLVDLRRQLKKIAVKRCPFAIEPKTNAPVTWVQPKMVCEVSFAEWTQDKIMRQPVFKGIRVDLAATDVSRELALHQNFV